MVRAANLRWRVASVNSNILADPVALRTERLLQDLRQRRLGLADEGSPDREIADQASLAPPEIDQRQSVDELREVVAAWPRLPSIVRRIVMTIVRTNTTHQGPPADRRGFEHE